MFSKRKRHKAGSYSSYLEVASRFWLQVAELVGVQRAWIKRSTDDFHGLEGEVSQEHSGRWQDVWNTRLGQICRCFAIITVCVQHLHCWGRLSSDLWRAGGECGSHIGSSWASIISNRGCDMMRTILGRYAVLREARLKDAQGNPSRFLERL